MLPMPFFMLPIQSNWNGAWLVAEKLISNAFDGKVRLFRRTQALTLLAALLKNPLHQEKAPAKLKAKCVSDVAHKVTEYLIEYGKDGGEAKPRYVIFVYYLEKKT